MSIFIDTADVKDAMKAKDLGWVSGITTNPLLLAAAGSSVNNTLQQLVDLRMGLLFYQLTAKCKEDMVREADAARDIAGDQLVLKIPPTKLGFQIIRHLPSDIPCCITALYSVAQALVAREAGVGYIAVYVNRATMLLGDGMSLLSDISKVLNGGKTRLLAASLKTPEEAGQAFLAGADDLTLPFDVLNTQTFHELSEKAVNQFDSDGSGLQF